MDFLMESGFMHWMSERMSFTNWVKADFHETSRITLKFSAPPRLRVRYRLGAGSSRYGNCFFQVYIPVLEVIDNLFVPGLRFTSPAFFRRLLSAESS